MKKSNLGKGKSIVFIYSVCFSISFLFSYQNVLSEAKIYRPKLNMPGTQNNLMFGPNPVEGLPVLPPEWLALSPQGSFDLDNLPPPPPEMLGLASPDAPDVENLPPPPPEWAALTPQSSSEFEILPPPDTPPLSPQGSFGQEAPAQALAERASVGRAVSATGSLSPSFSQQNSFTNAAHTAQVRETHLENQEKEEKEEESEEQEEMGEDE